MKACVNPFVPGGLPGSCQRLFPALWGLLADFVLTADVPRFFVLRNPVLKSGIPPFFVLTDSALKDGGPLSSAGPQDALPIDAPQASVL